MKRFDFAGSLMAENIDHAMMTLALDLLTTVAEANTDVGRVGEMIYVDMEGHGDQDD